MSDEESRSEMENGDQNDDDKAAVKTTGSRFVDTPSSNYTPVFVYLRVGEPNKDGGGVVKYKILSQKLEESDRKEVERQYEDFEFLYHNILTHCDISGVIVPPIPTIHLVEPKLFDKKPVENDGLETIPRSREALELQRFLELLIVHPSFGSTSYLKEFLTSPQAAVRPKFRRGFIDMISSQALKVNYKIDLDMKFQKEYESLTEITNNTKESLLEFQRMIAANQRCSIAYAHLASTITQTVPFYSEELPDLVLPLMEWSGACDDYRRCVDREVVDDEGTLAALLSSQSRFLDSAKAMLDGRLRLLSDYGDACLAVDKAKPQRKGQAEEIRTTAEQAVIRCTNLAKKELKTFHHDRVLEVQEGLMKHAEAKLKTARHTHNLLHRCLTSVSAT